MKNDVTQSLNVISISETAGLSAFPKMPNFASLGSGNSLSLEMPGRLGNTVTRDHRRGHWSVRIF